MKSKTLIEKQLQRKTNPSLVETLIVAKKNDSWLEVAGILSGSRRKRINFNLNQIDKEVKNGEKILIPGKVLSQGEITKKIKIIAWGFSKKAKEKLLNSGCEIKNIFDEIKSNPSAKELRILK